MQHNQVFLRREPNKSTLIVTASANSAEFLRIRPRMYIDDLLCYRYADVTLRDTDVTETMIT